MKQIFRSPLLALAASLFLTPAAFAADSAASAPITALDGALISSMKAAASGQRFQARYQALAPVVEQSYDLPEVTKNSVGFLWSTLPADQQKELTELFTQFTISSYVSQFDGYSGQTLTVLPTEKTLGQKKIIETKLGSPGDSGVEIDYVVADSGNGWKINDVLLNGTISQVAVHASDFASLVKSGDASQLISALKSKIKVLQGG
jgi:phospholipid transport system substrate-binding protein